jgi:hypothetical protein
VGLPATEVASEGRLRDRLPSRYWALLVARYLDRETLEDIGKRRNVREEGVPLQLLETLRRARLLVCE